MESIVCKYQQLCAVDIFHHYFLDEGNRIFDGVNDLPPDRKAYKLKQYNVPDWLQIEPADYTRATMHVSSLVFKKTKTGFILVTKTTGPDKPGADVNQLVLEFWLRWAEPDLTGHTAMPLLVKTNGKPALYAFGNAVSRNNHGAYPEISLPVPPYNNARTYEPGDIVKSGTRQFVALHRTTGNGTNLPAFWRETDRNLNYVTSTSLQARPAGIPPDVIARIQISGKAGLGDFSVLTGTNTIKAAQVYKLHLDKF